MPVLDRATVAQLRQWRRRRSVRASRLSWWVALLVALLHLLLAALTLLAMRPPAARRALPMRRGEMLEVRFLPAAPAAKPTPRPAPASRAALPSHQRASPGRQPLAVSLPAPAASVAPPRWLDRNGQVRLPAAVPTTAPLPRYVQVLPAGDTAIMRHDSPVTYTATRFDKDWGHGHGALGNALEKVVKKTTVKHTFHLLPGIRIHCAVSLVALSGGCGGDPPPPPPPKDGDVRLDMAPARPLAPDPHAAPPSPLATCIALYRAGKPLAQGCPSDTPLRAIDVEQREEREQREQRERQARQAAGH